MDKPFSQACENNKRPIARFLAAEFKPCRSVLEIGSGTGQHAVFFASVLPWLEWQASDRIENHAGIRAWIHDAGSRDMRPPLELDVNGDWPQRQFDAVFTANTFHIMSWAEVQRCIAGTGAITSSDGRCAVYGPFNVAGQYTSESNAAFDASLRERDPAMGIRDVEAVEREMAGQGFLLHADLAMPANNRLLLFRKPDGTSNA